jgi:hypothetical protein
MPAKYSYRGIPYLEHATLLSLTLVAESLQSIFSINNCPVRLLRAQGIFKNYLYHRHFYTYVYIFFLFFFYIKYHFYFQLKPYFHRVCLSIFFFIFFFLSF